LRCRADPREVLEGLDPDGFEAVALRALLASNKRLAQRQVRRLRRQAPTRHRDKIVNHLIFMWSEIPSDVAAGRGGPKAN
jgi:hypothetical protein